MSAASSARTVIFDFDGTLMDSLSFVVRSVNHALEPYTTRPLTRDSFAHIGGPPERFFLDLVEHPSQVPAALRRLEDYHAQHGFQMEPFAGAAEALRQLQAAGHGLAIWTGRDRESTLALLAQQGWSDYFAAVVCGDDLDTHKPHPEGMREILRRRRCPAEAALFLGDADVDVLAGHASGVSTVLIQHQRAVPPSVRAQAWRVVATPAEAYQVAWAWASTVPA